MLVWHTLRIGAAAAICCLATWAGAQTTPIKISVFAFELEDFSPGSQQGSAPAETEYLAQATEEARRQFVSSGRYSMVDVGAADLSAAKGQGLRHCGGCETSIARALGADQALIGVITRISMTEYIVRLRLSDARNGQVISTFSTDLRMGANYSWSRGVRSLMQNQVLGSK